MAKILKISGYVIDHDNQGYDKDTIEQLFDNDKYLNISKLEVKESESFEWYDEIDINFSDAKKEAFEKYFEDANRLEQIKRLKESLSRISSSATLLNTEFIYLVDFFRAKIQKYLNDEFDNKSINVGFYSIEKILNDFCDYLSNLKPESGTNNNDA